MGGARPRRDNAAMVGDDRLWPPARWVFLPLVPLTAVFGPLLVLALNRWRTAILATIATIPFAYAMIIATLLHLDRFATGSVRFWVWLVIYLALPVGLPVILLCNRRADPGVEPGDVLLPRWMGR